MKKHIKLLETKKLLSMSFDSLKSKLEKERQEVANLRREKAAIESELREVKEEKEKVDVVEEVETTFEVKSAETRS